ncbi:type 1 fimbrial protein [Burkholderia sp. JSH-S8]|nr:type 1 fimbrial protein [Burkholderia sp. JSH-S8]
MGPSVVVAAWSMLAASGAIAQSSPTVTLNFRGTYETPTCTVVGASDLTVDLPSVSAQSLAPGKPDGSKVFTIPIQCESGVASVRMFFSGTSVDPVTGNLIPDPGTGGSAAGNVQVRLQHGDGVPIHVGNRSTMRVVPITTTQPVPLEFIASYYATGSATVGNVRATAIYVIEIP